MTWTPRRKSAAFSAAVLLVALAVVGASLASANGLLQAVREGRDWWQERSLTHHTHGMSVLVGAMSGGGLAPVAGAVVVVERIHLYPAGAADGSMWAPVFYEPTEARTDAEGRAVFELAAGPDEMRLYHVEVTWGGWSSAYEIPLAEDTRVRLYFDEEGNGTWRWIAHRKLAEGRETATLRVGLIDWRDCEFADGHPVRCKADAVPAVAVHRVRDGERAEAVGDAGTVRGGVVEFDLPIGVYDVVVSYEGQEVHERLLLACDWERLHEYDGEKLVLESQETCGGWTSGGEGPPEDPELPEAVLADERPAA